jgi:CheY-like chemotaxis protein
MPQARSRPVVAYVFPRRPICVFYPMTGLPWLWPAWRMPKAPSFKLLIVDDHVALRRTVRQIFEGFPVLFLEAGSGEEAVKLFAAERPDWVIMDLRMPGMGGIKATEAIRLCDANARVIVISQFTEPEYRDQARRAGAVEFVDKEDMSHLVEIIRGQPRRQP